jgi:hypothetical protein
MIPLRRSMGMRKGMPTLILVLALGFTSLGCSREYAVAVLEGLNQSASAPMTICRTTYAARKGNAAYYTTCNTIGGY